MHQRTQKEYTLFVLIANGFFHRYRPHTHTAHRISNPIDDDFPKKHTFCRLNSPTRFEFIIFSLLLLLVQAVARVPSNWWGNRVCWLILINNNFVPSPTRSCASFNLKFFKVNYASDERAHSAGALSKHPSTDAYGAKSKRRNAA